MAELNRTSSLSPAANRKRVQPESQEERRRSPLQSLMTPNTRTPVRRRRIASHLSQTRFMYATTTSAVTIVGTESSNVLQDVLAAKVIVNISSDHMEELNSVNMCGVEEYFKNARLLNPACGAHGERATVSTAAEVTKNLKQSVFGKGCTTFVNTLKTMRGVAIAGGSIAAAVLPHTRALTDTTAFGTDSPPRTPPGNATASDIDIVFFNNMSRSEVVANVARLCTLIPGNTVAGVMCSSFKLDVVRPPPFCNISFLLNVGSTLESILCGFDLDACQVAFDGRQVLGTPRALAALSTRTCVLHRTCDPRSFDRVMKYVERGYTMAVPRCLSNGMDHNATLWLELIGKLEAQEHRMRLTGLHEPNVRGTDNGPHEDPDVVYIAEYIGLCRTMGRAGGMPEYYKYPVPALRMATELSPYGETFLRWRDTVIEMTRDLLKVAHWLGSELILDLDQLVDTNPELAELEERGCISHPFGIKLALPKALGPNGENDTANFNLEPDLIISLLDGSYDVDPFFTEASLTRTVFDVFRASA